MVLMEYYAITPKTVCPFTSALLGPETNIAIKARTRIWQQGSESHIVANVL